MKELNHNSRNAILGMKLEIKRVEEAIIRFEEHLRRMKNAVKKFDN